MPSKMKAIEAQFGKPLGEIIPALYLNLGSQTAVAAALGVSQPTVSLWLIKLGLVEKTVVVPAKKAEYAEHLS